MLARNWRRRITSARIDAKRFCPSVGMGSLLIDHLFLIALAMRKIFFGLGIAMPADRSLP